jgi:hypothetical protein
MRIPNAAPALNIPPITSQLFSVTNAIASKNRVIFFIAIKGMEMKNVLLVC